MTSSESTNAVITWLFGAGNLVLLAMLHARMGNLHSQADKADCRMDEQAKSIERIDKALKDQLVRATDTTARAEGHAKGMEDQRAQAIKSLADHIETLVEADARRALDKKAKQIIPKV